MVIINSLRRFIDGTKPKHPIPTGEEAQLIHKYMVYRFKNAHMMSEQAVWNQFRALGKFVHYDRARDALLLYPVDPIDITQNTYVYLE